jgi:predicted RNA polymerase sigma factor
LFSTVFTYVCHILDIIELSERKKKMEISQEENQTNEKKERQTLKNGMEKEEDETNYRHRILRIFYIKDHPIMKKFKQ